MMRRALGIVLAVLLTVVPGDEAAHAAGPWRGEIVDADTGAPLEGVVVLAYWTRQAGRLLGWSTPAYHGSEEVLTNADGTFAIAARPSCTIPFVTRVRGPEWIMFKPGYGRWRFVGSGHGFGEGERVLIALPRLRTDEERRKFFPTVTWSSLVPVDRAEQLREARDHERLTLQLGW